MIRQCRFHILVLTLFAIGCIFPVTSHALFGGKIDNFTAKQVTIDPSGKTTGTADIYMDKNSFRMDGVPGNSGRGAVTQNISMYSFQKEKQHYIFNHDARLYYQTTLDEDQMMNQMNIIDNPETQTVVGKEKVSGFKCVVKEITSSVTVMGMTTSTSMTVWQNDDFPMPLKTRMEDGTTTELRQIKKGAAKKKHFKLPDGYRKTDNMMQVFGMDMASMMNDDHDPEHESGQGGHMDMENVDMEEMMKQMQAAMGDDMDPAQMEQAKQAMAQAMTAARKTRQGSGAADGIWEVVPRRPEDTIESEMYTPSAYTVVMGTRSSLEQVFSFYGDRLVADGWMDGGRFLQGGEGQFTLMKGNRQIFISTADNPGTDQDFNLFYQIQLVGADI